MINQATLQGNWNEIKGKLRKHWGQLSNDDVQTFNGNIDQLVGLIRRQDGRSPFAGRRLSRRADVQRFCILHRGDRKRARIRSTGGRSHPGGVAAAHLTACRRL